MARYQINGITRYMGVGSAFDFDLGQARERNSRLVQQKLADAVDPLLARQSERAAKQAVAAKAMIFAEATRRFLEQHGAKWDSRKHRAQWRSTLETYAEPIIGKLSVADIDVPLVLKVLEQPVEAARNYPAGPPWNARPETASRLRKRVENILDWATVAVPNGAVAKYGVSREIKRRALRQWEAAGLVVIERGSRKTRS